MGEAADLEVLHAERLDDAVTTNPLCQKRRQVGHPFDQDDEFIKLFMESFRHGITIPLPSPLYPNRPVI